MPQDVAESSVPKYSKRGDPTTFQQCIGVTDEDTVAVNAIRCLSAAVVGKAKSGHPGAPMGCAVMAHALFGYTMNVCGEHPDWPNRDRFVLSNGHASALQYVMLYLVRMKEVTMDSLQSFRQFGSNTPGHPESHVTPGVEVTTGPLGQGISNAVGLALGARIMKARYGESIINNKTYVIMGDGCLQEGISQEACSLAGTLKLGGLIALYDRNGISIDGSTDLSFTDDIAKKFRAWDWEVMYVHDADRDLCSILNCLERAGKIENKPCLIICDTTIGYGSIKQGTAGVHGAPLTVDDLKKVREMCGFSDDESQFFTVPEQAASFYEKRCIALASKYEEWKKTSDQWKSLNPEMASEFERRMYSKEVDAKVFEVLADLEKSIASDAPRNVSAKVLKAVAEVVPDLVGGSADLMESNKTGVVKEVEGMQSYSNPKGRYIYFGVREHAMCAIANGLVSYGGFRSFDATFFNFYTYAWGAVRLSALSLLPTLHIATHDSIELGEDGPTHQPIEVAALCRATPNLHLIRPGDSREVVAAYHIWLKSTATPVIVALARNKVPNLDNTSISGCSKGAYILKDFNPADEKQKIVIASSGSELHIAAETAKLLIDFNVRLVSMPSWSLFEVQTEEYKQSVFPESAPAGLMEPYSSYGIERYFDRSLSVCLDDFGCSAPVSEIRKALGFTPEAWAAKIRSHFNRSI